MLINYGVCTMCMYAHILHYFVLIEETPILDCSLVRCQAVACRDSYIPAGQCCPVCPPPG